MTKVQIIWNGQGGELEAVTVKVGRDDDYALTNALIKMVQGNIITPGDSFQIEEVE